MIGSGDRVVKARPSHSSSRTSRAALRLLRSTYVVAALMFATAPGFGTELAPNSESTFSPPIVFDFDVPGGEYQSDERPITCSVNTIQGELAMAQYRWHAEWHPGIKVFLTSGSGTSERLVALAFSAKHNRPPFRVMFGSALDDSKDLGSVMFQSVVGQNGSFSFLLHWNANGDVTAVVAGEEHTFNLGGRPEMLRINGSGGVGSVRYELGHTADRVGDADCKPIS